MLKRIIASAVMATANHTMRPSRSQRPRKEEVAGGEACALISPTPRPCSLVPSVTTPFYSTTVSRALRQPLRSRRSRTNFGESPKGEVLRIPIPRTSVNKPRFGTFGQKFIGNSSPLASNEAGEAAKGATGCLGKDPSGSGKQGNRR